MSKAKRLVGIVFAVLFAVSAFACSTRLQAGQTLQGDSLQSDGTALAAANEDEYSAYLFVYFVSDGYENTNPDGEQVYFSVSQDGANWEPLNGGKPILRSNVGENGIRDPHIIRKRNDDGFYIVATDLSIDHGHLSSDKDPNRKGGEDRWGTSQTAGSRGIIVWETKTEDGINPIVNWGNAQKRIVSRENASCTWAPESIWDKEKQAYMVFWSSKTSEDWNFRVYRSYTTDYEHFSEPEVYIEREESYIDTSFIEADGWYYRFTKNENTGKYVIMEKSQSLSGPFTFVNTYTINGVPGAEYTSNSYPGSTGFEGPTGFKMNGEDKWYLLLDGLNEKQGYVPFITDDISKGEFVSAPAFNFGGVKFRHGSCIPIKKSEYTALLEKYNHEQLEEGSVIYQLDFEDNVNATVGRNATAHNITYTQGVNGKAAVVSVENDNSYIELPGGTNNVLKGLTTATISFDVNVRSQRSQWMFYAAPSNAQPAWPSEKYIGILYGDSQSGKDLVLQRWYNTTERGPVASTPYEALMKEWHHITVSFYGDSSVLYVDGVRKASVSSSYALSQWTGLTSVVYIGRAMWSGGEYSNFWMDNFKIYNYAMNAEQVAQEIAA